jgi:sugar phosphate permease
MFTYAGGSFITGPLGDRFSPSAVIGIGLLGSSVCLLLIAIGSATALATSIAYSLLWFASIQFFHGFFQATGGPVNTAIMGNWFPKEGRGLVFGLWTCHQYMGDIVAALFSAWVLESSGLDWRYAIIVPMVLNGIWAFVNFLWVPNTPKDIGMETDETRAQDAKAKASGLDVNAEPTPIGIVEAFQLPNVMGYAIAFGFFKLINYAMFFQLPVILSANFDSATANIISALYSGVLLYLLCLLSF